MLAWYRELIALRRSRGDAMDGEPAPTNAWYDSARNLLLYSHADLLVCCNLGEASVLVPEASEKSLVLASDDAVCVDATPSLNADSVAIWSGAEGPAAHQDSAGVGRFRLPQRQ
jgi:hypothetical protein